MNNNIDTIENRKDSVSVLFVCLGNICRSPTADGVFRAMCQKMGKEKHIDVDSAGTAGWHIGGSPDTRSIAAAKQRGYDLSFLKARQVSSEDFQRFDYVLAMDTNNLMDLKKICQSNYTGTLALFLTFAEQRHGGDVPDPYHGEVDGFDVVLDLVEDGCRGLFADIQKRHGI